jgi:hypothetical protein
MNWFVNFVYGKPVSWILSAMLMSALIPGAIVFAQTGHDMQNMPRMSKRKPVPAKKKKTTTTVRKRRAVKKRRKTNKPATNMPGMNMPQTPAAPSPQTETPKTQPSPQSMPMNMPGMQMPAVSPSPQASPQQQMPMNMPGMQMPAASPSPQASPQQQMEMNMPMPAASPGASPQKPEMNMPMPQASPSPGAMENMPGMAATNTNSPLAMSGQDMAVKLGSSASNVMLIGQMGSGTSWQPISTQMYMVDRVMGKWLLMFHYNIFAGINRQGGPRGATKFESGNWFMPMAYRQIGKGTLQLRGMFSAEPFTFPPGGSPLLFQTGETYKGQPLIDRQHPHDLFMELSAQYTVPLGERGSWFTYVGYPGEPALGPVAFMHRASASENPSAALAHHLQDSTHISCGVLTTGFSYRWFKLEGSIFNGREPGENRYDFDAHKWNSRSVRLSIAPNPSWTFQISHGFLRSPEGQEPDTDIRRTTASVQYNRLFAGGGLASAFIWGRNHTSRPGEVHNLNGYTFETTINFLDKNYLYTRMELVDKNELLRAVDRALLGITDDHPSFRIGAYTFGGARDIWTTKKISLAIGSDVSFYSKPSRLDVIYGDHPVSWKLFLRLRPGKMQTMTAHGSHGNTGEK